MDLPVWYSIVAGVAPVVFQQDPGEQETTLNQTDLSFVVYMHDM